ncbi:MAG: hypothetical protein N2234_04005 [Planctomycetota bacterium]|nr:hypothetical protein [Planctomycetota bacterium]
MMYMNKEKVVLVVGVILVVFSVWQIKSSVSDPVELPEIPPLSSDAPPPDVELGVAKLFEEGEIARLLEGGGRPLRNPWERYEGLVEPNSSLIQMPKPSFELPAFLSPPLSNAPSEVKRRGVPLSRSDIIRIKVTDRPAEK